MLNFNPFLPPTVEQCLASPYFEKVKAFSNDKKAKEQVVLDIENHQDLSMLQLRKEFNKIVNDYQQSVS